MSESLIDVVLAPGGLNLRFQPIFDTRVPGAPTLHAIEALARGPRGTNLEPAGVLFEYVRRKRMEHRVDRACLTAAFASLAELPGGLPEPVSLHVNVHAATLGRDGGFLDFTLDTLAAHGLPPGQLTLEIVESGAFWEGAEVLAVLDAFRRSGVRLALDDVGLGDSNFRTLLEYQPDYYKVDGYFVRGAGADPRRRAVLEAIATLAERFGAQVVGEGVEEEADFAALEQAGIHLVQGYLFARPAASLGAAAQLASLRERVAG